MSVQAELSESEGIETPLRSRIGLVLGPAAFLVMLFFVDLDPSNPMVTRMAAVIVWMAIWWITEAIPLSATGTSSYRALPAARHHARARTIRCWSYRRRGGRSSGGGCSR